MDTSLARSADNTERTKINELVSFLDSKSSSDFKLFAALTPIRIRAEADI